MKKVLAVTARTCVGCRTCELACSIQHEGSYVPWLARIRIIKDEETCTAVPNVCRQCRNPRCVTSCPVGAIRVSPATGSPVVDEVDCIGCRQCLEACPFGAVSFNPVKGVAVICDLCGGSPACAAACPTGALRYITAEEQVSSLRRSRTRGISPAGEAES